MLLPRQPLRRVRVRARARRVAPLLGVLLQVARLPRVVLLLGALLLEVPLLGVLLGAPLLEVLRQVLREVPLLEVLVLEVPQLAAPLRPLQLLEVMPRRTMLLRLLRTTPKLTARRQSGLGLPAPTLAHSFEGYG